MQMWQEILNAMEAQPWDETLWSEAAARRSPTVTFVYPRQTTSVRCTDGCALNCAHCGGVYLNHMQPWDSHLQAQSLLVSGGCDPLGRVPFQSYAAELRRWRAEGRRRLNFHVGLIPPEEIPLLEGLADAVSFDFVYDSDTIANVYGLDVTPERYLETYRSLAEVTKVVPHICIGLNGGRLQGEMDALQCLQKEDVPALAFIVFIPTPGTAFAHCQTPPLRETAELLASARRMFPEVPLHLGCMRPRGQYRNRLDALALAAGMDKIVQPTPWARRLAVAYGLDIHREEECCSL